MSALAVTGHASTKRLVRVDPEQHLLGFVLAHADDVGGQDAIEELVHKQTRKLVGSIDPASRPKLLVVENFVSPIDFSYPGSDELVRKGSWICTLKFLDQASFDRAVADAPPGLMSPVVAPAAVVKDGAAGAEELDPETISALAQLASSIGDLLRCARRPAPINLHIAPPESHVHLPPQPDIHIFPRIAVKVEEPKRGPVRVEVDENGVRRYVPE
jgi:hypothetical protein